nr:unnamed protein product [Callosobruchus chinensis]
MVGSLLQKTLVLINVCSLFVQAEDFLELYVPRPEYPTQLNNWLSDVQEHKNDFDTIRKAAIEDRGMKKRDLLNLAFDAANIEDYLEGLDKGPTNDIYPHMYKTNEKSAKSIPDESESRVNSFQKTYRSPLRLRRDSYRADLEKINNVDIRSKGSIGEIKRYVRSKSDDNKFVNYKRKRDIKIDVLSDGKLLKEFKNENGGRSVVLNIQSIADTQQPDLSFLNTEDSQFRDTTTITDLVREVGNIGKMEKQPVASPGIIRVQGYKGTNFRNKNDIASDKSGEYGIIKQSPAVEKLKENDPNFKNLFNENDKLNTDISMAKDVSFPSTMPPIEAANAANIIRQQQNVAYESRHNPQNPLTYYTSFTNNGLQDMSKFWSPTEKSLMQAGIQIAQGIPDSKSEGFEEVTSMVIDNKDNGAVNIKKYPNKRQLDDYASKILRDGYFVKENDVLRQVTDLPVVPNVENIVVNEFTIYTNGEVPKSITEEQLNSVHEARNVLNTDRVDNCEEMSKPVEDLSDTLQRKEEFPESADSKNEKVSGTSMESNPLPLSKGDMANSLDDQNTIGSNIEVATAPIQQYDGNNIRSTELQRQSESQTHIFRKDKFFIGHQVVTEIETIKELEPDVDEGSMDTMNMLNNMEGREKAAETLPDGIKTELAKPALNQQDVEYDEEDSQQLTSATHLNNEHQLRPNGENKQPEAMQEIPESKLKHTEKVNENQDENIGHVEYGSTGSIEELNEFVSKHEEHHHSELAKGNPEETSAKNQHNHDTKNTMENEKPLKNGHGEHQVEDEENAEHHRSEPSDINSEDTPIENKNKLDWGNIEHNHHEIAENDVKPGIQVESGNEHPEEVEDNTECNDIEQIEHEQSKPDEDNPENKQDTENQNMDNVEEQTNGIAEDTCNEILDEEADVGVDRENIDHHDRRVDLEDTKLEGHTEDNTADKNLNTHQDAKELDRFNNQHSSHVGDAGREEGYENSNKDEEFEMTECQSKLEENTDKEGNDFQQYQYPVGEEKYHNESYTRGNHNHHPHKTSGNVEEEQDADKKHRQHGGTQVIIINNAKLKDGLRGFEAEHFSSPQSKRRKKERILVKNKRTFKTDHGTAKSARYFDRRKSVRRRRKEKHRLYRLKANNGRRYTENSGADLNKHYLKRRLGNADVENEFKSSNDASAIYVENNEERKARKRDGERLSIRKGYIHRKLQEIADYIYDPSIEKSEEEYDTNDATEVIDVTEKRRRKVKGAVEGDYGDEEDSMTEKKNGGKIMIKKTKNEFAYPRTTTEEADDDDYYDEIEGMVEEGNIEDVPRKVKATIAKKVHKKVKKPEKTHAARTKQDRSAFRKPRQSDYSKTNPEFQQWPKFMISDQENEEQLRKRSLAAKQPVKSKKEKFKKSLKDFFLKPAPKKRFDIESLDFGGSTPGISGITTSVNGKDEGSSGIDAELSTVLSILNQELQSQMDDKSTEMPKLDDILDGRLPSMIRDEILDRVKNNENFKRLHTAIRTSRIHVSNQTDTNSQETRKMLHYMTQILERLQFATTCQVLPPSLRDYLRDVTNVPRDDALKRLRDMEELQLDENQNDPNNNYLFRAHAPMDKLEDKAKLLEELLEKYNKLPDQCKPRAEPVREYIENHLGLVNKMLSGQETSKKSVRRVKDYKRSKPESRKSDDLIEQQLESLGLGKSKTFNTNFDLDELVTRHRRQKSILFEDEEDNTPGINLYDVQGNGRTVSSKYSKLSYAIEQEVNKHKKEQTLAKVYGEPNSDYYNESPKEKREASNYNFETPLVYSL